MMHTLSTSSIPSTTKTALVQRFLLLVLLAPIFTLDATRAVAEPASPIQIGQVPPVVELSGKAGGAVKGGPWSSDSLKGKAWLVFYVDPDKKSDNEPLEKALKAANLDLSKHGSVAVINMDATWIPNRLIDGTLEDKQKEFPNTLYVKDMKKALVKSWGLTDDAYVAMIFNKKGELLTMKAGALNEQEIKEFVATIKKELE